MPFGFFGAGYWGGSAEVGGLAPPGGLEGGSAEVGGGDDGVPGGDDGVPGGDDGVPGGDDGVPVGDGGGSAPALGELAGADKASPTGMKRQMSEVPVPSAAADQSK